MKIDVCLLKQGKEKQRIPIEGLGKHEGKTKWPTKWKEQNNKKSAMQPRKSAMIGPRSEDGSKQRRKRSYRAAILSLTFFHFSLDNPMENRELRGRVKE